MNMLVGMALSLSVLSACRKDRDVQGGGSGASYLSLSIDSACIQAPNVFTPNSDGVNDALWIAYRNITTTEVTVRNSAGDTLFHTTLGHPDHPRAVLGWFIRRTRCFVIDPFGLVKGKDQLLPNQYGRMN